MSKVLIFRGLGAGFLLVAMLIACGGAPPERARPTPKLLRGAPATLALDLSSGVPIIEAQIGEERLRLIVDTGAGWCVLSPAAVERAKLVRRAPDELKAHDAAGTEKVVEAAHVDRLTFLTRDDAEKTLELGDFDVIVLDSPVVSRAGADGILGLPLLARAVVAFDFAAGTMQVGAPPLNDANAPGVLPLCPAGNGLLALDVAFDPPPDIKTTSRPASQTLVLDTGFSGALHLPEAVAKSLAGDMNATDGGVSATALQERRVQSVQLESDLVVGAHRITRPTASVFPGESAGAGAIGMGLLREFNLTIDLPRRRARLVSAAEGIGLDTEPPTTARTTPATGPASQPRAAGYSGMPRVTRGMPADMPMSLRKGVPIVEATIDGHSVRVCVDTGAAGHMVTTSAAKRLGLSMEEGSSIRVVDTTGEEKRLPFAHVRRLQLGSLELEGLQAVVVDSPALIAMGIDGIVGLPAFAAGVVTFDYPAGRVRVTSEFPFYVGAHSLPLRFDALRNPLVAIDVGDWRYWFVLDTGKGGGFSMSREHVDRFGIAYGPVPGFQSLTMHGRVTSELVRLATDLPVAGVTFRGAVVELTDPNGNEQPRMGGEVLRYFVVSIDARARQVRLVPTKAVVEPEPEREIGFTWSLEGKPLVDWIRAGSPAERGGLRVGDEIVTVAGRSAQEEHAREVPDVESGKPFEVVVRRGGEQVTMVVEPHVLVP